MSCSVARYEWGGGKRRMFEEHSEWVRGMIAQPRYAKTHHRRLLSDGQFHQSLLWFSGFNVELHIHRGSKWMLLNDDTPEFLKITTGQWR